MKNDKVSELRRAETLRRGGKPEKALEVLRSLLSRDPKDLELRRRMAELLVETGKRDEAISLLVRLSEHLGEVVLINFWATWCGPCRQEMPLLDQLYAKYRLAGLVLLSVNIDEEQAPAAEMARTLEVTYPVLFDARKDVSRAYDVGTMPLTVLVDREGVVRYVSEGYKPGYEQRYTEKLRELLNE